VIHEKDLKKEDPFGGIDSNKMREIQNKKFLSGLPNFNPNFDL